MEMKKWIKTDDGQYVYKQSGTEYWVSQIRIWFDDYCVAINLIDFDSYDIEDIEQILYYYGYDNINSLDGQIIAECLAEELDDFCAEFKGTYEECEKWLEENLEKYSRKVYNVK